MLLFYSEHILSSVSRRMVASGIPHGSHHDLLPQSPAASFLSGWRGDFKVSIADYTPLGLVSLRRVSDSDGFQPAGRLLASLMTPEIRFRVTYKDKLLHPMAIVTVRGPPFPLHLRSGEGPSCALEESRASGPPSADAESPRYV